MVLVALSGCANYTVDASDQRELRHKIGMCYVAQEAFPIWQPKNPEEPIRLFRSNGDSIGIGGIQKGE